MLRRIDEAIRTTGRTAIDRAPWLGPPLTAAREQYVKRSLQALGWRHRRQHTAEIDPYQLLWVDPDEIEYVATAFELPKFQRLGRVRGGDWDTPDIRFAETDIYQGFSAHFDDGVPWTETGFFARVEAEIAAGRQPWGCHSREQLLDRCGRLDQLYERIKRDGYLSQPELIEHSETAQEDESDDPLAPNRSSRLSRLLKDEVAVDIGRDGQLLFSDGRNRLAIAKLLSVEQIPVLVLVRHDHWQQFRDCVASHGIETGSYPSVIEHHPDLQGLGSTSITESKVATPDRRPQSIAPWL